MANNNLKRDKNGRFISSADTITAGSWFKNAAKSLGYAGIDLLKQTMPATMGTIDTNKEWAVDLYKSVRASSKNSKLKNLESTLTGKALDNYNQLQNIKRNAISDLKTGKFYNNDRSSFDDDFGDFDDDFSFSISDDLDDDNFTDEESKDNIVVKPVINITSNINNDNPMVQAVRQQSRYLEESAKSEAKRDITLANAQMGLDKKIGETLYGGMQVINSNLGALIGFNNEHMSGYIGASLKYYEDNINIMSQINENIKKLQTTIEESDNYNEHPLDSIISVGDGSFDMANYVNLVKKQLNNTIDESMLGSIKSLLTEGEGLAAIAQSPLKFVGSFLMGKVVPEFLTNSLKAFDDSFKSFVPALLNKVGSWADDYADDGLGMIKELVGKIFGIRNDGKTTIDTSNYQKGAVPFDGITRKTIVEVIPGYLSKILSALTGKEEIIFDSNEGKFITRSQVKENYDRTIRRSALSEFESLDKIKDRVNAFIGDDPNEIRSVYQHIDDIFFKIANRKKMVNPNIRTDKNGITHDDLIDLFPDDMGTAEQEMIRNIILSLSKAEQMKLFGRDHISARRSLTETLNDIEKEGNAAYMSLFNGLYDDSKSANGHKSIFETKDRFGKNNLDYLRDIRTILLEGIKVQIINRIHRNTDYYHDRDITISTSDSYSYNNERTAEDIARDTEQGINRYGTISKLPSDSDEMSSTIDNYIARNTDNRTQSQKKPPAIDRFFRFIFSSKDRGEMVSGFFSNIRNSIANSLDNFVNRVDRSLYNIVFGNSADDDKEVGFFEKIKASISGFLFGKEDENGKKNGGFFTYLRNKFFDPIKEAFIGENGVITKFKQSEFYKNLVGGIKNFGIKLFGEKDEDGNRSGGKFSEFANSVSGFGRNVVNEIKGIGTSFKDNIKEWLFGTDADKTKEEAKGVLSEIGNYFKEGFQGFTDALFGKKFNKETNTLESEVKIDDIITKIKERAPKAVAGGIVGGGLGLLAGAGGFGILGSLFLGPMSGVVIGSATALLAQSESFKTWLFGPKDADGRAGGFISKSTQEFFKEHKGAIVGGTALGMLKGITGIGILPSFILGGPVTGALFGLASSLLVRSEMFQNMLFGKKDESGNRAGGIVGKLTGKINSDDNIKRKLGFAGAGLTIGAIGGTALSSFGILGSLAFGPLSGAIIGAGAGIALAANKWKDKIFGTFDKDGNKTENGILNKMMAKATINVLQPIKIAFTEMSFKIQDWFEEKIAEPIIDSVLPIKEELRRIKDRLIDFGKTVLEKLHIPEFIDGAKTFIGDVAKSAFNGIKFVTSKAASGIVAVTKAVLQAPVNLVHFIADKILLPKHMREGIKAAREQIIENIKNSDFVQKIVNPVVETVKDGVTAVKDFTFKAIRGTFKFFGKALLATLKGVAKVAGGIIAAPFKVGIGLVKGTVNVVKGIGRLLTGNKDRDDDRLGNIQSGNRGFIGSIADLAALALPGSSLRESAKYSAEGAYYQDSRIQAREQRASERAAKQQAHADIIKRLKERNAFNKEQAGAINYNLLTPEEKQLMSFDEFNKIVDNDRQLSKEKKAAHKVAVKQVRAKLSGEDTINYDMLSDEEKALISKGEFSEEQNKIFKKKYGKEYKNMTKMQKETFAESKLANNAVIDTQKNTKTTADVLTTIATDGITIKNSGNEEQEKTRVAVEKLLNEATSENCISVVVQRFGKKAKKTMGVSENDIDINTEDKSDMLQHGTQGTTVFEATGDKSATELAAEAGITNPGAHIDASGSTVSRNTEDKSDVLKYETQGKTVFESLKEQEEKEQVSVFDRIEGLLSQGNKDRKEHSDIWGSIFSKKGLITGALIALSPFIIKFFKEILPTLSNILGSLGVGATDLIQDYQWTEENSGRTDGNTITEEAQKTIDDLKNGNILTDSEGNANTRTDSVLNFAARQLLNFKNRNYVGPFNSKTTKFNKLLYRGTNSTIDFITGHKFTGGAKYSSSQIAEAMGTSVDDVIETFGKNKNISTKQIAKYFGSSIDEVDDLMTGALKPAEALKLSDNNTLLKKVSGFITQFFDDIGKKFTEKFGKSAPKWISKISPTNIISILSKKWNTAATKIASVLGVKGGAAAVTGFVSEAIFATISAVNGISGTAKLFQVSESKVDGTMKLIAGIFGALTGTTVGSIIDIVFSIVGPIIGVDILSSMAIAMYNLVAGDDKSAALKTAQEDFKNLYLIDRTNTLYSQYNTQKQAGLIGEDILFEDFQKGVIDGTYSASYKSFADWNVEQNASIGDKIGSGIGKLVKGTGKALSNAGKFLFGSKDKVYTDDKGNTYTKNSDGTYQVKNAAGQDLGFINKDALPENVQLITEKTDGAFVKMGKGIATGFNNAKTWAGEKLNAAGQWIGDTYQSGKQWAGEKLNAAGQWIGEKSNAAKNKVIDYFDSVSEFISDKMDVGKELLSFVKDNIVAHFKLALDKEEEIDNDAITVADDDPLGGIKKSLQKATKVLFFIPYLAIRSGKLLNDNILTPLSDGIKKIGSAFVEDSVSAFNVIKSNPNGIFTEAYWTAPEGEDGPVSTLRKLGFYAQRVLTIVPGLIGTIGHLGYEGIKKVATGIKKIGSAFVEDSVSAFNVIKSNPNGIFTEAYWTAPEGEDGSVSGLRKAGFYAQRILTAPVGLIGTVGHLGYEGIKKTVNGVKKFGSAFVNDSVSAFNVIKSNPNGIFSEEYWTAPEGEDGSVSGLRKTAFYAQRILTIVPGLIGTIGHLGYEGIKKVGTGLKNIGSAFAEDSVSAFNVIKSNPNGIFSSEYWTAPEGEDGSVSGLRKAGFYAQRVLTAPIGFIGTVGMKAANGIANIWSGAKDLGKLISDINNTSTLTTNTYWNFKPHYTSGPLSHFEKIIFYVSRAMNAPSFYLNELFNKIKSGAEKTVNSIKDVAEKIFKLDDYTKLGTGGGIGGPIDDFTVTSGYNENDNYSIRNGKKHNGIDLSKFNNAPIESFTDGTVVSAVDQFMPNSGGVGNTDGGGYGNHVFIKDDNGYYHRYGHLNLVGVQNGQRVSKGTVLGLQGNTGNSTGSHLHYEVRKPDDKTTIDPSTFIGGPVLNGVHNSPDTTALQQALVDKMLSIYGKLDYTLGSPQDPDRGAASCASTVAWAYNKVLGFKPGGSDHAWVPGQAKDDKFTTIYRNDGKKLDLNMLQPGDIVYQDWDNSKYYGYDTLDHAEMYGGLYNGKPSTLSHGNPGKKGPVWKEMNGYRTGQTMLVRRYTPFIGNNPNIKSYDASNIPIGESPTTTPTGTISTTTNTSTSGLMGVVNSISSTLGTLFKPLTDITSALTTSFSNLINGTDATVDTEGTIPSVSTDLEGSDNAEKIWRYLKTKGLSDYAVAGIMGNLYHESALRPNNLQNSYEGSLGSDDEYTAKVDNGSYRNFANDSGGYGLAQWTYSTRKKNLLEFAKSRNASIADLGMQLDFLWKELNDSYGSSTLNPMKKSNSVTDASTIFLQNFERPAGMYASSTINKRASTAQSYYNKYAGIGGPIEDTPKNNITIQQKPIFKTVNKVPNSNLINKLNAIGGPNTDEKVYDFLNKIVDVLVSIKDNTHSTTEKISELKSSDSSNTANVAVVNNNSNQKQSGSAMYDIASNRRAEKINKGYTTAKLIASGAQ